MRSDDPEEHDRVTGRPGSYARTRANIEKALSLNVPLRVGMVDVLPGQRIDAGRAELESMGVRLINSDRARAVGRAALPGVAPSLDDLCGWRTRNRAAVLPNGDLSGCVLSRNFAVGNQAKAYSPPSGGQQTAPYPLVRGGTGPSNRGTTRRRYGRVRRARRRRED